MKKQITIPVFVPEVACPNRCVYCNQHAITGKFSVPSDQEAIETIDTYTSSVDTESTHIEIGFFGGSFTGIDKPEMMRLLSLAESYRKKGIVNAVRLSTRPDYINKDILQLLKQYHVTTIELGAQCFDDKVLRAAKRNHSLQDIVDASKMIKDFGFRLGLQMMIGLPEDNEDTDKLSAQSIIDLKADDSRIYPVIVIKDTELEELHRNGSYRAISLEEGIDRSAVVLRMLMEAGVNIIRLGLHPSDSLLGDDHFIAGPWHPSMRELVLSRIWFSIFEKELSNVSGSIIIRVPERQLNAAIGHKATNREFLLKSFEDVRILPDSSLKLFEYEIDHC